MNNQSAGNELDLLVFGGTFDPPHQGHLDCVELAAKRFPSAAIVLTPTPKPPVTGDLQKLPEADFDERIKLLELLFADRHFNNKFFISRVEKELPEPNYTYQLLEVFKEQYPNKNIGFIIGQDQLNSFHLWNQPDKILKLASLVVIRRDTEKAYGGALKKAVENCIDKIGTTIRWDNADTARTEFEPIFIISQPICIANSTMIRKFYKNKQDLPEGWVPTKLSHYIKQHNLYIPIK